MDSFEEHEEEATRKVRRAAIAFLGTPAKPDEIVAATFYGVVTQTPDGPRTSITIRVDTWKLTFYGAVGASAVEVLAEAQRVMETFRAGAPTGTPARVA